MKKKFAFILPYIGRLPSWFQLWLNSCARNSLVDWLLFIDDHRPLSYPNNVKVHYCSFDELRNLFQQSFPFPISLKHPYRFCDFRPSFGDIFKNYLLKYDFWGHCDPDLIWGNLNLWFTDETINMYDRISHWGHCSLYKNTPDINTLYKKRIEGIAFYQDVYSNDKHIAFDEEYGMNILAREKGIREYILPFFDVKPTIQSYAFTPTFVSEPFFPNRLSHLASTITDEGVKVYGINTKGELVLKDFAYIHLQKRKMDIKIDMNSSEYLIIPNRFIPLQNLDVDILEGLTPGLFGDFMKRQVLIWNSRIKYMKKSYF